MKISGALMNKTEEENIHKIHFWFLQCEIPSTKLKAIGSGGFQINRTTTLLQVYQT